MKSPRSLFPPAVPTFNLGTGPGVKAPRLITFISFALLVVLLASAWRTIDTSSVLLHLKTGDRILETGQVPKRDIFSASSFAVSWQYIEWGWGVVLASVYKAPTLEQKAMEWAGISLLNIICVAFTALFMIVRARRRGARLFESLATTAFVIAALLPTFQATPERIALVLFLLALLAGEAHRLRYLVFLPFITLVWANTHPAFLLPAAIPFARMILPPPDEQGNTTSSPTGYLFVIIMTCIAAMLVNPNSIRIMGAAYTTALHSAASTLTLEAFMASRVLIRLVAAGALIAALAPRHGIMYNWEKLLAATLLVCTIISPTALTFLLIYLAAPAAVRLSKLLSEPWQIRSVRYPAGLAICMIVIATGTSAATTARLTTDVFGAGIRKNIFPETAAGRLASLSIRRTILNAEEDGGFLIWRTWPAWKITMDQRPALYSPEQREQYDLVWRGATGWQSLLTQWSVYAVLGTTQLAADYPDQNLYYRLADSSEWTPVYWDRDNILYVHSSIDLRSSNLVAFRALKPGISWSAMADRVTSPKQWRDLAADLRRVTVDDPLNAVAHEFLTLAEEKVATLD